MKQVRRCYVVNEHNHVKRIPLPQYQRLTAGSLRAAALAGKAVRFAETTLWLDEDRIIVRALTCFPLIHFDCNGQRDLGKLREEMALVTREIASSPDSAWSELYRAERFAAFRWVPTQDTLERLRECLPHNPTQAHSEMPRTNL